MVVGAEELLEVIAPVVATPSTTIKCQSDEHSDAITSKLTYIETCRYPVPLLQKVNRLFLLIKEGSNGRGIGLKVRITALIDCFKAINGRLVALQVVANLPNRYRRKRTDDKEDA